MSSALAYMPFQYFSIHFFHDVRLTMWSKKTLLISKTDMLISLFLSK